MRLKEIIERLDLDVKTPGLDLEREVTGGYVSDLLSDVIGNAQHGNVWVTIQIHLNIVAVASLKGLSGIILVNNRQHDSPTLEKALSENIPLMTSSLPIAPFIYTLF